MNNFKLLIFATFLACLLCAAANSHHKHRKQGKIRAPPPPPLSDVQTGGNNDGGSTTSDSTGFSVMEYGAKGNGVDDDSNAFAAAWADACKAKGSTATTILVPSGFVFLVKQVSFSGRGCLSSIVFQLDGKIIAPTSSVSWKSGLLQWLEFTAIKLGITIRGKGIIDGRGSVWWSDYSTTEAGAGGRMPSTKPTAVRFYGSTDVTVTGITIQNSPQTHLKFDNCSRVQVFGISISSPGDSPNTDGIHLQNSKDVLIHTTSLACGDDCISIQNGCTGVYVHSINCGPGHGISIGSLGKDGTTACVSNITVRDITLENTMTGVRIKTWQGGAGVVQGVMFSNIQVSEVETPIIIDQYYCNGHKCANKTSAVAVSGVSYQSIKGTYTANPVRFACSDSAPCGGITLARIELNPVPGQKKAGGSEPFCWKAYGRLQTATTPPIGCLEAEEERKGQPPSGETGLCRM